MASPLDGVLLAILLIAVLRGVLRGLIRESFSIASLAGACLAVRYGTAPLAAQIEAIGEGSIGSGVAPWIAGALIAVGAVALVAVVARFVRRGAAAAGLGLLDRLGGGALGAAEGVLISALILIGAIWIAGRDHPLIARSKSLAAYEDLQVALEERGTPLPDIAAPPRR